MSAPLASRRDALVICARCGRKAQRQSRQQRFCSARCKERARTRVRRAFLGTDTGAPAERPKKPRQFKALQRAKLLSSRRILAPADVLTTEVWGGREWQRATGSGGVLVEISRLRARALVS
jgi:hypothetical protein